MKDERGNGNNAPNREWYRSMQSNRMTGTRAEADVPTETALREFIALRIDQLLREERAYRTRLGIFRPFSQLTVVAGVVFPLIAGSTLLTSAQIFGQNSNIIGGILSLVAAALVGIHKGLGCDAYQSNCRRTVHGLRSVIEGYERTSTLDTAALATAIDQLESRLNDIRGGAPELPPPRN